MITKERLKKLKYHTIYSTLGGISKIYLDNETFLNDERLYEKDRKYGNLFVGNLEDLFETKEEAEWHLEFGNIKRIETLKLPTWEEFITNDKYNYYGSSHFSFDNYRLIVKLPTEDDDCEFIGIDVDGNTEIYDWEEATKENYIEACRLCKKLFLGEEE